MNAELSATGGTLDRVECPRIDRSSDPSLHRDQPPTINLQGGSVKLHGISVSDSRNMAGQTPDFARIAALEAEIAAWALAQVGKGYDYRGIAGFLARKDLDNADKFFCSELVSAAFWKPGIPLLRRLPHAVAPGDLRDSPLLRLFAMLWTPAEARRDAEPDPLATVPGMGLRVAVYSGRSPVSRAIRFRTWSEYSHAALVLRDNTVIEALPGRGVVHHPDIRQFHRPGTCIEILEPIWPAILAVLDAGIEQRRDAA